MQVAVSLTVCIHFLNEKTKGTARAGIIGLRYNEKIDALHWINEVVQQKYEDHQRVVLVAAVRGHSGGSIRNLDLSVYDIGGVDDSRYPFCKGVLVHWKNKNSIFAGTLMWHSL